MRGRLTADERSLAAPPQTEPQVAAGKNEKLKARHNIAVPIGVNAYGCEMGWRRGCYPTSYPRGRKG
jgi:hypothetical protein